MKCTIPISRLNVIERPFKKPVLWLECEFDESLNSLSKYNMEELRNWQIEIREKKKKTISSNNYMWKLCSLIADKLNDVTKEDVYRKCVRESGIWEDIIIKTDALSKFISKWESNGIGWFCDIVKTRGDYTEIRIYYGSQTYDGYDMHNLIDCVVKDAISQGIRVEPYEED